MGKILTEEDVAKTSKELKAEGKRIVLIGGCFDILHLGHIRFFREAADLGDHLFILLESDDSIKKNKGRKRPINSQAERAEILASIEYVSYIVLLKGRKIDEEYDKLIVQLSPDVIATTTGDKYIHHKKRQADLIKADLIEVIDEVHNKSTSRIAKIIREERI